MLETRLEEVQRVLQFEERAYQQRQLLDPPKEEKVHIHIGKEKKETFQANYKLFSQSNVVLFSMYSELED